ncbi:hypothetical protein H4W80_005215 [Nonomuraea angiospora]|uniref:Uncharacterized protein n=1 Tax=Nonomuraea angiospora TaxID=46172 RepID=A0ABR9M220_9ACTN|nr:hypothetical protein [Nonomuraea angiospora]MBE1586957.1 hypothetical protein [Nonomuraea angiospora]
MVEQAFAERSLLEEAGLLDDPPGRVVPDLASPFDDLQIEGLEGPGADGTHRCGGDASPARFGSTQKPISAMP